ncbi:DUF2510 domain-containing protein [Streptomyces sp. ISL-90]|nr:DUF2510 domain-containing protein [Streptomyces sp. ISL-90]
MSDLHTAPAGWYPEPSGTDGQRWWDGTRWTEYATPLSPPPPSQYAPYGYATQARLPEGTPVYTVWIWLIVVLPILPYIPLFFWDYEGYLLQSMTDPTAQVRMYLDPMYLGTTVLGWLTYGVLVWFAYLDTVALRRLGYAKQFHWAWTFLMSLVYVIGRSVVVKRQAGYGATPIAVGITLYVGGIIGVLVWMFTIVANLMSSTIDSYPAI